MQSVRKCDILNIDKERRCRNDNNTAQTKYTHGVAVKPEPQKVKERVMEDGEKEAYRAIPNLKENKGLAKRPALNKSKIIQKVVDISTTL